MSRTILAVSIALIFTLPLVAAAMARAPFPSATKLQPIPAETHANISGNVNATAEPVAAPAPDMQNATATSTAVPETQNNGTLWGQIVLTVAVLLFALLGLWFFVLRGDE